MRAYILVLLLTFINFVAVVGEKGLRGLATLLALLGIVVLPLAAGYFAGRDYGFKGLLLALLAGALNFLAFLLAAAFKLIAFKCPSGSGLGCIALLPILMAVLFIIIPGSITFFCFIGGVVGAIVKRRTERRREQASFRALEDSSRELYDF